jgi:hypothetical protein
MRCVGSRSSRRFKPLTEKPRQLDQRIAAEQHVRRIHILLNGMQTGAARPEQDRRDPGVPEYGRVRPELAPVLRGVPPRLESA